MRTSPFIIVVMVFLVVLFGALGARLFYLQCYHPVGSDGNSSKQTVLDVRSNARRGQILDRKFRVLADSRKSESVFAEPRVLGPDRRKETAAALQAIIETPGPEISRLIRSSNNPGFVRLMQDITVDQRNEIRVAGIEGVGIQSGWRRCYPMGAILGHVVGFVGTEHTGLAGVEQSYNSCLSGTPGSEVFVVDVGRRPIAKVASMDRAVSDGAGVVLTIDTAIQQFARKALVKQYEKYGAESATAVVMNPWNGEILAMVSIPEYDSEQMLDPAGRAELVGCAELPLKNRALCDPYEPGSIFKPIVAAVGIDCGAISTNDVIYCENGYYARYRIGEFLNHPYGNLSVKEIIAKSSNVGMAKIGLKLGKKRLYEGVRMFGFGRKTGIDLPGEDAGVFLPTRLWDGLTVTRVPFGHAVSATAIQILRGYCILANGGRPIKPHMVMAIVDNQGKVKNVQPPGAGVGQIITPDTAEWMVRTALVAVVNEGTGKEAQVEGVQVFGKTGTANIAKSKEQGSGYDKTNYIASFVGGAPADKPEVMVLVSICRPDRSLGQGYSGGRVAAPVFREIMQKTWAYLHPEGQDN